MGQYFWTESASCLRQNTWTCGPVDPRNEFLGGWNFYLQVLCSLSTSGRAETIDFFSLSRCLKTSCSVPDKWMSWGVTHTQGPANMGGWHWNSSFLPNVGSPLPTWRLRHEKLFFYQMRTSLPFWVSITGQTLNKLEVPVVMEGNCPSPQWSVYSQWWQCVTQSHSQVQGQGWHQYNARAVFLWEVTGAEQESRSRLYPVKSQRYSCDPQATGKSVLLILKGEGKFWSIILWHI